MGNCINIKKKTNFCIVFAHSKDIYKNSAFYIVQYDKKISSFVSTIKQYSIKETEIKNCFVDGCSTCVKELEFSYEEIDYIKKYIDSNMINKKKKSKIYNDYYYGPFSKKEMSNLLISVCDIEKSSNKI